MEIKPPSKLHDSVDPLSVFKIQLVNDNELLYHLSDCIGQEVFEDMKSTEQSNQTDLLPGLYEGTSSISLHCILDFILIFIKFLGGAKVWECTTDLANYLIKDEAILESLSGKTVLDLGCGAGLLGILTLQYGASVYFQDYVSSHDS